MTVQATMPSPPAPIINPTMKGVITIAIPRLADNIVSLSIGQIKHNRHGAPVILTWSD
jgi:hypothetical protein